MKIYNVQIKTMEKRRSIENGWIEIENGKIIAVEEGSPDVVGTEDLDGQGKLLIPGFIDAHTHLGMKTASTLKETTVMKLQIPLPLSLELLTALILWTDALKRRIKGELPPLLWLRGALIPAAVR